jgi:hypothetical protein
MEPKADVSWRRIFDKVGWPPSGQRAFAPEHQAVGALASNIQMKIGLDRPDLHSVTAA